MKEIPLTIQNYGGDIPAAQKAIALSFSDDLVPLDFIPNGITPYGKKIRKISDTGTKFLNGERRTQNIDNTLFFVFHGDWDKQELRIVNIHDLKTKDFIKKLEVPQNGTNFWWHPFKANSLFWAEGYQLKEIDVFSEEIRTMETFFHPVEEKEKAVKGDGNGPDYENGRIALGLKNSAFIYDMKKRQVLGADGITYAPSEDFETANLGDVDYAQTFDNRTIIVGPDAIWLGDLYFNKIKKLTRRAKHTENGFWMVNGKRMPGIKMHRINDIDAEQTGLTVRWVYIVVWDELNNLIEIPTDRWPSSNLGGHTGGQSSWGTDDRLYTALNSAKEYDKTFGPRCNEVYEHRDDTNGKANRICQHGINGEYETTFQPEVRAVPAIPEEDIEAGVIIKGPDGTYFIEVGEHDTWAAIQKFIETGEYDGISDPPQDDPPQDDPPQDDPPQDDTKVLALLTILNDQAAVSIAALEALNTKSDEALGLLRKNASLIKRNAELEAILEEIKTKVSA